MWLFLSKLLQPPSFPDERKTRAAGVLHVILLSLFIVFGIWAAFVDHPITVIVTASMAVVFFGLWLIMRRGFVTQANWLLLGILIIGITLIIYQNGSIRIPAVSGFVACIAVAGLTQSKRATIGTAVVISAILYVLYRAEIAGKLPPVYYQTTGFLQWLTYAGVMCITAILLVLAQRSILNALYLARSNAAALSERNQELQTEIAERQQAEHALRESEERYRTLFELGSEAILVIDTETTQILDANTTVTQMFGYKRNELLSMSILQLSGEPLQTRQLIQMQAQSILIPKGLVRTRDERIIPMEITGRFFEWQGKKLLLIAARDITERVRSDEALREYREHLEDQVQERTAALTIANQELESFSFSLAHDLRAPLRAIEGFSRAILEDHAERIDPEMHLYLGHVIKASEDMKRIIDALLSLYRLTLNEIQLEQVNLSEMAASILDEFCLHEPQRSVERIIPDNLTVVADRQLMQIVLANLLGNAWKFSAMRNPARIELGKQEGEVATYFIRDNGAGFDMTYADKLFGIFQRLHSDEEFPGTGIGLATVKRIIKRHHGDVWATGEVDQGATIYFTIP